MRYPAPTDRIFWLQSDVANLILGARLRRKVGLSEQGVGSSIVLWPSAGARRPGMARIFHWALTKGSCGVFLRRKTIGTISSWLP